MKKVFTLIILIVCIGCFIYTSILLNDTKSEDRKIKKNIQNITTKIDKITKDNNTYTKELDDLKKKNQSKDADLKVWEKAKEKLKKALS